MSAGDDYNGDPGKVNADVDNGPMEDTAEIYKPPYLFRGAAADDHLDRHQLRRDQSRPRALPTIGFNGSFGVNTPNTNIAGAALAAPAAVTHGVDMNQRMLELDVDQRTGCVSVTAPTNRNAAPPGYYMLFLLNDQGVPSDAKWVKLQEGGPLGGCGTAAAAGHAPARRSAWSPPTGGTVAGTIEVQRDRLRRPRRRRRAVRARRRRCSPTRHDVALHDPDVAHDRRGRRHPHAHGDRARRLRQDRPRPRRRSHVQNTDTQGPR